MVSMAYIERASARIRTRVSNAFRRALGLPPLPTGRRPRAGSVVSVSARDELMECFANGESPMDGRRA